MVDACNSCQWGSPAPRCEGAIMFPSLNNSGQLPLNPYSSTDKDGRTEMFREGISVTLLHIYMRRVSALCLINTLFIFCLQNASWNMHDLLEIFKFNCGRMGVFMKEHSLCRTFVCKWWWTECNQKNLSVKDLVLGLNIWSIILNSVWSVGGLITGCATSVLMLTPPLSIRILQHSVIFALGFSCMTKHGHSKEEWMLVAHCNL